MLISLTPCWGIAGLRRWPISIFQGNKSTARFR
jgi:hypothetical protein